MAFHKSGNSVVYSSPTWTQKFVDTDIKLGDTIADGSIAPWEISLGKYERCVGEVFIWYNSDNANELVFRMGNFQKGSNTTALTGAVACSVIGTDELGGTATTDRIVGTIQRHATDGIIGDIIMDSGNDNTPLFVRVYFRFISDSAENGTIKFQARNRTAADNESDILAGSYINYRKF